SGLEKLAIALGGQKTLPATGKAARLGPAENGEWTGPPTIRKGTQEFGSPCNIHPFAYIRRPVRLSGRETPRMASAIRWLCCSMLPVAVLLSAGCIGGTHNPSYFPDMLPFGDIAQTHAKPVGSGYYSNFDKHACHIECYPLEATNAVRTQHVL